MKPVGVSLGARGLVSLALAATFFALTGSVVWAAAGVALGHATAFGLLDVPHLRRALAESGERVPWSWAPTWVLVVGTIPLGLFSFLVSLTDNVPRLVLNAETGLVELGVFATFGYTVTAARGLTIALGGSANPRLAKALASGDSPLLRRMVRGLTIVSMTIGAVGLVAAITVGARFLDLAFGPEVAVYSREFRYMALYAMMFLVSDSWMLPLVAARKFKQQMLIQAATVVTVFVGCVALIPSFGLMGAVGALLTGGLVRLGCVWVVLGGVMRRVDRSYARRQPARR